MMQKFFFIVYFVSPVVNLQNARKVIGVELCSDAVEDAKINAHINGKQHMIINLWRYILALYRYSLILLGFLHSQCVTVNVKAHSLFYGMYLNLE